MTSTISQADLLEIYKAEGGGKSSWHCGALINLTTLDRCLLSRQHYKYEPSLIDNFAGIRQTKHNLHFWHPLILNLAFFSIYEQRMNVLFLQRQDCTFHVFSVKNLPAAGKVSTIWCYLPTLDTKRTKMLRTAGFVNVLFLCSTTLVVHWIELLILQVFAIEIFLHYTSLPF